MKKKTMTKIYKPTLIWKDISLKTSKKLGAHLIYLRGLHVLLEQNVPTRQFRRLLLEKFNLFNFGSFDGSLANHYSMQELMGELYTNVRSEISNLKLTYNDVEHSDLFNQLLLIFRQNNFLDHDDCHVYKCKFGKGIKPNNIPIMRDGVIASYYSDYVHILVAMNDFCHDLYSNLIQNIDIINQINKVKLEISPTFVSNNVNDAIAGSARKVLKTIGQKDIIDCDIKFSFSQKNCLENQLDQLLYVAAHEIGVHIYQGLLNYNRRDFDNGSPFLEGMVDLVIFNNLLNEIDNGRLNCEAEIYDNLRNINVRTSINGCRAGRPDREQIIFIGNAAYMEFEAIINDYFEFFLDDEDDKFSIDAAVLILNLFASNAEERELIINTMVKIGQVRDINRHEDVVIKFGLKLHELIDFVCDKNYRLLEVDCDIFKEFLDMCETLFLNETT